MNSFREGGPVLQGIYDFGFILDGGHFKFMQLGDSEYVDPVAKTKFIKLHK